jgi:hypothetical protein
MPAFAAISLSVAPPDDRDMSSADALAEKEGSSYGKVYVTLGAISFVGCITAFAIRSATHGWFQQLHLVHGCLELLWGCILLHQIVTGATRGARRRSSHRVLGSYIAPVVFGLLMPAGVVVVVRRLTSRGDDYGDSASVHEALQAYIVVHMAVFATFALVVAYVAAKLKNMRVHKEMVGFVVLAFSDVGLYSIVVILMHMVAPCGANATNDVEVVAHVINRALLFLISLIVFARYKRFTKLNVGMLVCFALAEIPVILRVRTGICADG